MHWLVDAGQSELTTHWTAVPAQLPLVWQTSFTVRALPSSQLMPRRGAGSKLQPVAMQVSTVQELLSLQPVTRHCGPGSPASMISFENTDSEPLASYDFIAT